MIGQCPPLQVIDGGGAGGGGAVHSTYSLSFDGSGWVDLGNSATLNPTAGMTISLWANFSSLVGIQNENWLVGRDDNVLGRSYAFGVGGSAGGKPGELIVQVNGVQRANSPDHTVTTGGWHHLAVTGDPAGGWTLYCDGAAVGTPGAWVAPDASTAHTNLGRRSYSTFEGYCQALLDDPRLYSRALSAAEIASLFAGTDVTGTAGYWPLEEGSGTSTADTSGNGDTGTLNGGVTWSASHPSPLN